jgi:hypothetical protein
MRIISRGRWLLVAAVVGLAAAGISYATIPGQDGLIHACLATKKGTLRLIDPNVTECKNSEQSLSWEASGSHSSVTLYENEDTLVCNTNNCVSPSLGGTFTWEGNLYLDSSVTGSPYGSSVGSCTVTDANGGAMCNFTAHRPDGDITAVGPLTNYESTGTIPVVGGTDGFFGARGTMTVSCNLNASPPYCTYFFNITTPA